MNSCSPPMEFQRKSTGFMKAFRGPTVQNHSNKFQGGGLWQGLGFSSSLLHQNTCFNIETRGPPSALNTLHAGRSALILFDQALPSLRPFHWDFPVLWCLSRGDCCKVGNCYFLVCMLKLRLCKCAKVQMCKCANVQMCKSANVHAMDISQNQISFC